MKTSKGKRGEGTDLTIAENARFHSEKIRTKAQLGDLAKEVHIVLAVYNLDLGRVTLTGE